MGKVDDLISERGKVHGDVEIQASIAQSIECEMRESPNWDKLSDLQRYSLEMISVKLSRILAGNHEYSDHWHDLEGYARLVSQRLK